MGSADFDEAGQAVSRPADGTYAGEDDRAATPTLRREGIAPDRKAAIERAIEMMRNAPDMGGHGRRFTRDEMYER